MHTGRPLLRWGVTQCSLPPHLTAARARKRVGLLTSAGLAVAGVTAGNTLAIPGTGWATATLAAVCGLVALASTGFGGLLRAELHNGRLYLQWGEAAPSEGPPAQLGAIEVRFLLRKIEKLWQALYVSACSRE